MAVVHIYNILGMHTSKPDSCMVLALFIQAVWFSACADLAVDAKRDLVDIGAFVYDPIRIHDLRHVGKLQADQKLEDVKARPLDPVCQASQCIAPLHDHVAESCVRLSWPEKHWDHSPNTGMIPAHSGNDRE